MIRRQTLAGHRREVERMAQYTCCGHDFGTAEAYREHRERIHGESAPQTPAKASVWRRLIERVRGTRT